MQNPIQTITLDRVQGMLEGVAIGDALGGPHEFRYNSKVPYTGKLEHPLRFMSRWTGTRMLVIGQVTDDTEMTLTLARSLLRNKGYNRNDVILSYERWTSTSGLIGINTKKLFKGVKTINGYETRYRKIFFDKQAVYNNQSNGTLMRCSPLALLDGYTAVIEDCKLTNPSKVNQDCSLLYITALRFALMGKSVNDIFNFVKTNVQTQEVKAVIDQVDRNEIRDVRESKGWVLHSFYCAMYAITHFTQYDQAINWIIRLGGDTDTNAAITGGLLGAKLGHNQLLQEPMTHYNLAVVINADTNLGGHPRLPEYTMADIYTLAQQLYNTFILKTS